MRKPTPALLAGMACLAVLVSTPASATELDMAGTWRGPSLDWGMAGIQRPCSGAVDWRFDADGLLVVDEPDTYGYSWSAGWWEPGEQDADGLAVFKATVMRLPNAHDTPAAGNEVWRMTMTITTLGDDIIRIAVDGLIHRTDGSTAPLPDFLADTWMCRPTDGGG